MRISADFNGIFEHDGRLILCLSHREACRDASGNDVVVRPGMIVTAFDEDLNEAGQRDDLLATGIVERPPDWLEKGGAQWILRIDERGVRHESDDHASAPE